jgi:hypothetical protein
MGRPTAMGAVPVGEPVEPWYYGAARLCASIAVAAAIVSVIVGIAVGVEASKYETSYGETGHHQGVLVLSILSGVLGAVLWVAVAAALLLLVEIGESLRRKAA